MDYAISDIHGCYKTLQALIHKINTISTDNTFYFLGDYIDRGPNSKQVLDFLIELKQNRNTINIIFVKQ